MAENDAKIELKISDNKMKVIANYVPPMGSGDGMSAEDIVEKLHGLGVTTGIAMENINALVTSDRIMRNIIVANGIAPKVGEKAHIIPYFDMNVRRKAVEKEDGSVDFRDLGEISSARKDQELYRKVPPTIGESGRDVMGNEIPGLPGRDLKLVIGPGTYADEEDPHLIRAANDGEIIVSKGVVIVSSVHKIDGDVDYSTGNVVFNGTIKINGTVKSGFKVQAEGDVEIAGNVEDAEVISGNDVIIHGGFVGTGEGKVIAGRDVIVKFVENQHAEAERDIIISGPVYHSHLVAGRSIVSQGGQSVIVGGQSEAKNSIAARKLGSEAGTVTILKVGLDPHLAEKLKQFDDELAQAKESLEKIEKSVLYLYRLKIDNNNQLPPDKMALLEQLEKTKKALPEKINQIEKKKEDLGQEQQELENAFVAGDFVVFPKVRVYFGQQFLSIDDKMSSSTFRLLKGEVVRCSK